MSCQFLRKRKISVAHTNLTLEIWCELKTNMAHVYCDMVETVI